MAIRFSREAFLDQGLKIDGLGMAERIKVCHMHGHGQRNNLARVRGLELSRKHGVVPEQGQEPEKAPASSQDPAQSWPRAISQRPRRPSVHH